MARTYSPHHGATPTDYIATGQLGPVQHVSAQRMLRACPYGWLYVCASDWPNGASVSRALRDRVAFTLVPVERNLRAVDLQARGETGVAYVATHGPHGERTDYELWNEAAAALHAASDEATLKYNRDREHYQRGPWSVGYLGSSGFESVWADCRGISAGLIGVKRGHAAQFLARHRDGARYRLRVDWGELRDGITELETSVHHLDGPEARVPQHVRRWCLSRCSGVW